MILIWQTFLSPCFLAAEGIGGWVESDADDGMVDVRE